MWLVVLPHTNMESTMKLSTSLFDSWPLDKTRRQLCGCPVVLPAGSTHNIQQLCSAEVHPFQMVEAQLEVPHQAIPVVAGLDPSLRGGRGASLVVFK